MAFLWIGLGLALILLALVLGIAYYCYRSAFFFDRRIQRDPEEFDLPHGTVYEPFYDHMIEKMKETRAIPHRDYSTTSFDGLTLWGTFYEFKPGAPIELMFHGYRGSGERDLCGGVQRCFVMGHSAFIVDQRGSGRSGGKVCTFGINERRDCLTWVEYIIAHFGPDVKIILTGISMGAATVMMAAGEELPPNVIGVLADCGYSSPKEIICKVIRQLHLPAKLIYPFVKLGARLFGHFDLEQTSAVEALSRSRVPVILFHGEADDFVPCQMSKACFDACAAPKRLVTVPEAGHGLAYPVDPKGYIRALKDFFGPEASAKEV